MVRGTSFRAIAVRFVKGGAFAWTPALAGLTGRRVILSVRVQRPAICSRARRARSHGPRDLRSLAIQAHAYGCASAVPSLVTTEIPQTDVLCCIVIGVVLVATLLTLEVLAVAIVVMGKRIKRTPLQDVS